MSGYTRAATQEMIFISEILKIAQGLFSFPSSDRSFWGDFVSGITPTLLAAIIGAYLLHRIVPKWQRRFEEAKERARRKYEIAESVSKSFRLHWTSWRRLCVIQRHLNEVLEEGKIPTDVQKERKERFVSARDAAKDELQANLAVAKLYFSSRPCEVIDRFIIWDRHSSEEHEHAKTTVEIWAYWEDKLIGAMREDLD
ncbi:hypothetical protein [Leisingera sp. ANG-M7]|uniref:hypothetical protein n=1 Tax=Leisingera sp. ANG-M7 TaxID=1577902 RepID=UPI001269B7BC|nr:hypothetical protein [Leisingera sp. ANG-M7]